MAYVIAAPDMLAAAATDVATIGSTLSAAHMVAAARTVALVPAAADEVSASIAHLFSQHAQGYQAQAAQAAAFQEQFVQHLTAGAGWYAATEAANAAVLQPLTASAGSFTSAIAALPGQLLNILTSFWDQFIGFLQALYNVAALAAIGASSTLLLGLVTLILAPLTPLIVLALLELVISLMS
jgi:hypothetical protein